MRRAAFLAPLLAAPHAPLALVNDSRRALIAARVEPALDSRARRRGLLGRDHLETETAFLIAPSNAVHTFGMRFPIDLLFVARDGQVLKRIVALPRRRLAAAFGAFATIELSANHPAVRETRVGDRLRLEPGELRRPHAPAISTPLA
jgi:uncharacterized membrane protein (UPF0127 family)